MVDVCKNATLHNCRGRHVIDKKIMLEQCTEDISKPMIVLFSWLGAKQSNYEKYVGCWTRKGHNVLLVKTSVMDLLCPKTGSAVSISLI